MTSASQYRAIIPNRVLFHTTTCKYTNPLSFAIVKLSIALIPVGMTCSILLRPNGSGASVHFERNTIQLFRLIHRFSQTIQSGSQQLITNFNLKCLSGWAHQTARSYSIDFIKWHQ